MRKALKVLSSGMTLIPTLGKLRLKGQEFKAILDHKKPYLKKKKGKIKIKKKELENWLGC